MNLATKTLIAAGVTVMVATPHWAMAQADEDAGVVASPALEVQEEDVKSSTQVPEEVDASPGSEVSQSSEWDDFDEDFESEGEGAEDESPPFELHGFVEGLFGARVVSSAANRDEITAAEARFRLELDAKHGIASARFRGDIIADEVRRDFDVDIRDASVFVDAADWLSFRVGRQVLTWGTGDFVFLNDLFPKDFVAFFSGRDIEYLKAPSNSIRIMLTANKVNIDLVWTPIFAADRYISGERFSFFSPMTGTIVGDRSDATPISVAYPSKRLRNGDFSARLYGTAGKYELAAYGYVGHWKQPIAFDSVAMLPAYAPLAVYGASLRGPLLGGLFNVEGAFYHSYEDSAGDNATTPNSQARGLVGYEHELFAKFQVGAQYYLEYTLQHDELIANSAASAFEQDEFRHLLTLRLTYFLLQDNLELSLFTFFSPSDLDAHIRPTITYKWTDELSVSVGANLMFGDKDHTFFGQLEQNTNVYSRIRYSF